MPAYASLTRAEQRECRRQVADGAPRSTTVRFLDLDHHLVAELSPSLVSGQTDISRVSLRDAGELTTRVFSGIFVDPSRSMVWDPDSPSALALWLNRMVQVTDGYLIDGIGLVFHHDFTGPAIGHSRKGPEAGVTCYGKEYFAQREVGQTMKFPEGTKVTRVFREVLEAMGETKFDIGDIDEELPNRLIIPAVANGWRRLQRLARSSDVQAYYSGAGRFTLRQLPGNPSMGWVVGDGLVQSEPQIKRGIPDGFANDERIRGHRLAGKRSRHAKGVWRPKPSHPLSAHALIRGGVPQLFTERHHMPKVKSDAAAERLARKRGQRRLLLDSEATFDVRPGVVPVDEGDLHTITTDDYGRIRFRVRELSIGYGADAGAGGMSINRIRRLSRAAHIR